MTAIPEMNEDAHHRARPPVRRLSPGARRGGHVREGSHVHQGSDSRPARAIGRLAALPVLIFGLALSACDDRVTDPEGEVVALSTRPAPSVVILSDHGLADRPRDPYRLISARVLEGDLLRLRVHFEGCMAHPFQLAARARFREFHRGQLGPGFPRPPRLSLFLLHDARGDLCSTTLQQDLLFDLTPVRQLFELTYGFSRGEVILAIGQVWLLYRF